MQVCGASCGVVAFMPIAVCHAEGGPASWTPPPPGALPAYSRNSALSPWGNGGVQEKGSIDRTINQLLSILAPNTRQTTTFLNPLDALIPKIPF